ncbi:MAG: hypothetical protein K2Q26_14765 [Bdellovibrionales bacterium]|nr:hypothetical protein [Bdellovibrionales bacterium]
MRGLCFFILIFLTNSVFAQQGPLARAPQGRQQVQQNQAGDIPQAIRCLRAAMDARMIQVNYQISGDNHLVMRGIQEDETNRQNVRDTYYLFRPNGQAQLCNGQDGAGRNQPPQLSLDRSLTQDQFNHLRRDCTGGGDQHIHFLMKEVKGVVERLAKSYKLAVASYQDAVQSARRAEGTGDNPQEQRQQKLGELERIRRSVDPSVYYGILNACAEVNNDEVRRVAQGQSAEIQKNARQHQPPDTRELTQEIQRVQTRTGQ